MAELLPDNLELVRRSAKGLFFKDSQEEGAGGRLEGLGGLVNLV